MCINIPDELYKQLDSKVGDLVDVDYSKDMGGIILKLQKKNF